MIYLDHAATTPIDPRVIEEMMPFLTEKYGNPGSLHSVGREAAKAVALAREKVAEFFNCRPDQVIFTSGGSEGNNMVFAGLETELRRRGKTHVITTQIEHDSVLKAAKRLCIKREFGFSLNLCRPNPGGEITADAISELINDKTGLVSVMAVNNETGIINDIENIYSVCKSRGVLFHTDCVQAAGIEPLPASFADAMTISSHKINGPKGVGAMFIRDPILFSPLISGGANQEFGFRGGTENVAGIVGFGKACEIATDSYLSRYTYLQKEQSQMIYMLLSEGKKAGVGMQINGDIRRLSPKTMSVSIDGIDAETLLLLLDAKGVCLSAGSACTSHENTPSHVLKAMGLTDEEARSTIRISISHTNTAEEINEAARTIIECAAMLKKM